MSFFRHNSRVNNRQQQARKKQEIQEGKELFEEGKETLSNAFFRLVGQIKRKYPNTEKPIRWFIATMVGIGFIYGTLNSDMIQSARDFTGLSSTEEIQQLEAELDAEQLQNKLLLKENHSLQQEIINLTSQLEIRQKPTN